MSTTALIRRAILAGAASITALALPALIASAPAAAAAGTRSRPILRLSTATRLGGQRLRRPKRQPAPSSPPSCMRARDVRPSPCGRFSSARLRCGPGRRARRPTRAAENGPTSHRPTREASIELWRLILRMRLANRAAREAFQPNLRGNHRSHCRCRSRLRARGDRRVSCRPSRWSCRQRPRNGWTRNGGLRSWGGHGARYGRYYEGGAPIYDSYGGGGYYEGGAPIYDSCGDGSYGPGYGCPGYGVPFVGAVINGIFGGYGPPY